MAHKIESGIYLITRSPDHIATLRDNGTLFHPVWLRTPVVPPESQQWIVHVLSDQNVTIKNKDVEFPLFLSFEGEAQDNLPICGRHDSHEWELYPTGELHTVHVVAFGAERFAFDTSPESPHKTVLRPFRGGDITQAWHFKRVEHE